MALEQRQSYEELVAFFRSLPTTDEDRPWEVAITRRVGTRGSETLRDDCRAILDAQERGADPTLSPDIAYCAFFALATYYRRAKSFTDLEQLLHRYAPSFKKRRLYPHLLSLLYKGKGSKADMVRALEYGKQAVEKHEQQEGVLHSFVETVALCMEMELPEVTKDDLAEADQAMDDVLKQMRRDNRDYPKYYCTRGRLLALRGDYSGALDSVAMAIDKEDPEARDYAIRLSDYQALRSQIQFRQSAALLQERIEAAGQELRDLSTQLEERIEAAGQDLRETRQEMRESLEDLKKENLTILGFFTAIISVTIGSIQLLGRQSFDEAAMLIIVLTGAMLTVYAGFASLFSRQREGHGRSVGVIAFGVALMAAGLLIPRLLAG